MNITRPVNVTWVMWSKRLLGHKAWDKWALWIYFYYFLCIDYQSVIHIMHSQEMPTCPFLTKWLRHRFCIQTWEHRIESCSWWTETFGPSRKLLQCWTTMTKDLTKNSGLKKTNLLNEVSATKSIWNLNKSLVLGFWQKCVYLWYTKIILMLYMLLKIIFSWFYQSYYFFNNECFPLPCKLKPLA